jgi:hypothetical protein
MINVFQGRTARSWTPRFSILVGALCATVLLLFSAAQAQTTSSISGMVKDTADALVPGAKVTLVNEANKGTRTTTSNDAGYFFFAAVQPAIYRLQISREGFESWTVTGIEVHPGDSLTVPKIKLAVGKVVESVVVTAEVAGVALNSGEHSALITTGDINRLSTTGRDVSELVSVLPGFTVNAGADIQNEGAGGTNGYQTMGFGSGQVGAYGANGAAPQQGLVNVTSDGANVIDPGDMGGQISNINMDQVQEVKVQTSNFGADEAKGPIVINAVGKSGSDAFHGGVYTYFRNAGLNSNDWLSKYYGTARAERKYFYPGATLGGPVKIPGTHFNENKHLVFWAGFEYYGQQDVNGFQTAFVPPNGAASKFNTSYNMVGGDMSTASIANALNVTPEALTAGCPVDYTQTATFANVAGLCWSPGTGTASTDQNGNAVVNGDLSKATGSNSIDPATAAFTRMYPAINRIPQPVVVNGVTQSATDGINYAQNVMATHNGFQFHTRIDENISETLKLYGTYNLEKVNDEAPIDNNYDNALGTVPFATPVYSNTSANYLTLNLTKTVGASLTNELVGSGVYFYEPQQFADRAKALDTGTAWAAAGYSGGYLKNGVTQLPIINNWTDASGMAAMPGFQMGNVPARAEYLRKYSWNVADNVTKQWRTHSFKVGVYTEETANNQLNLGSEANGALAFMRWDTCYVNEPPGVIKPGQTTPPTTFLGNQIANFLTGCAMDYSQDNFDPSSDLRFRDFEGYVTDEWKVNPKLTLTLGIRLAHQDPWTDAHGVGLAVWDPAAAGMTQHTLYSSVGTASNTWLGVRWHKQNPDVPLAGVPTEALFYSPRLGLAYDLYGNGKTVFRGGWGVYRSHDSYNNAAGALNTTSGLQTFTLAGAYGCTFGQLFNNSVNTTTSPASTIKPCMHYYTSPGGAVTPFSINALDRRDNQVPVTYNYNFTVDQQALFGSTFEIAYSGNQSTNLSTQGNLQNQNVIPLGAFFAPDPVTGQTNPAGKIPVSADYRLYPNYNQVNVPNHVAWANYNALQTSWNKQRGSLVYGVNYTWSKALGVRGNYDSGYIADPVNMHHDYGIVSFDRRQVFNATYSYQEGVKFHGRRVLGQVLNGWEISGITSLQSGPDLAVLNSSTSFGLNGGYGYTVGDTKVTVPLGGAEWLGSSDYTLQPTVTCDPRQGLKKDQFVNGNCFGLPKPGTQGAWNLPDVHGPAFFKSDLSVYKDFTINDRQNMQFRLSGFNFLNHPITSFNNTNLSALALSAGDCGTCTYTDPEQAEAGMQITNASTFGSTAFKNGQRIVELGFKYNF